MQVSRNDFEPTFIIFFWLEEYGQTRGISILGEVHNVEI